MSDRVNISQSAIPVQDFPVDAKYFQGWGRGGEQKHVRGISAEGPGDGA